MWGWSRDRDTYGLPECNGLGDGVFLAEIEMEMEWG